MAETRLNTRIILRNDTSANWSSANPILLLGEAGYETDTQKLKFGDGSTAWNSLAYFGEDAESIAVVYQIEIEAGADHQAAITSIVGSNDKHNGDIVIVKELIADGHRQYTAYVYDGTSFIAMDGNYSAENVILKSDITLAGNYTQVGNLTKTSTGTAVFSVAGKSVAEALTEIFSKRLQPSKTEPSVSITLTGAGTKEVGTSFTPSYTAKLNAGSYTYGPATGITASSWAISDTNSNTATTASGELTAFTVSDGISYKVTATATYDAGATAYDNLGSTSNPVVQIAAGSKSATSSAVTGYRQAFYGSVTDKTGDITSAVIRGLSGKSGKAVAKGNTIVAAEAVGAMRVIIAVPASVSTSFSSIKDVNGLNAETLSAWTKTTVAVEGANGYTAVDYTVYYKDNAEANGTANTWSATI